jgi:hypothetical protein
MRYRFKKYNENLCLKTTSPHLDGGLQLIRVNYFHRSSFRGRLIGRNGCAQGEITEPPKQNAKVLYLSR